MEIVKTNHSKTLADQKICELLNCSEQEGMQLMFDTYYRRLVIWADSFLSDLHLSEDLVQDFFISVWNDKTYLKFKAESLASFLYVSIRNRCYNRLEKNDVFRHITGVEQVDLVFEEYNQQHDLIVSKILEAIDRLPERSREIMYGVFVEGLKYRDVAERYDISLSTVKTLLGNSVKKLREQLGTEMFLGFLFFFVPDEKEIEFSIENLQK